MNEVLVDGQDQVTAVICRIGKLPRVDPDEDFYKAGFSSISALELLLELESACEVSIADDQFIAARTPRALHALIRSLKNGTPSCGRPFASPWRRRPTRWRRRKSRSRSPSCRAASP